MTNPSNEPDGAKLFGLSKVLLEATTVGDILWKDQGFKIGQSFQVPQADVGDPGLFEVEILKIGESLQMDEARAGIDAFLAKRPMPKWKDR